MEIKIAPSLLAADWLRLGDEVEAVQQAGADLLHLDVMDGHFVPNLTMGPKFVAAVASVARVPLDVHLMIEDPGAYLDAFIDAGATTLGFHAEPVPEQIASLLARIHDRGRRASLTLSPETPASAVEPYLDAVEQVLVMSVSPGFGRQKFIAGVLEKVRHIRSIARPSLDVEVDGGITPQTAPLAVDAGANVLVAGTSVFGTADRREAIDALRRAVASN